MAGRERSGVEYSDDKVFLAANYIVAPTKTDAFAAEFAKFRGFLECGDTDAMRKIMRDVGARHALFDKK